MVPWRVGNLEVDTKSDDLSHDTLSSNAYYSWLRHC
jgi:hypothetical protein